MRLKKLQETINNEIEQETRKAKMDKELAIKLVYQARLVCLSVSLSVRCVSRRYVFKQNDAHMCNSICRKFGIVRFRPLEMKHLEKCMGFLIFVIYG
jgi:hypothetical protein